MVGICTGEPTGNLPFVWGVLFLGGPLKTMAFLLASLQKPQKDGVPSRRRHCFAQHPWVLFEAAPWPHASSASGVLEDDLLVRRGPGQNPARLRGWERHPGAVCGPGVRKACARRKPVSCHSPSQGVSTSLFGLPKVAIAKKPPVNCKF